METVIKKIKINEKEDYKKIMNSFYYTLKSEEIKGNKAILTFERDETLPFHDKLVELEAKTNYYIIPNYILLILMLIAIGLMTTFIILAKTMGESFNTVLYFALLFIPALICLTLMVVVSFIRNKQISKYISEKETVKREVNNELMKIKEQYGSKND